MLVDTVLQNTGQNSGLSLPNSTSKIDHFYSDNYCLSTALTHSNWSCWGAIKYRSATGVTLMNTTELDVLAAQKLSLKPEQQQAIEVFIPEDGLQKFVILFTEEGDDEHQASLQIKGGINQATFIFRRWANVTEFDLPSPKPIGCTDHTGRTFYVHFAIHTEHDYSSERSIEHKDGQLQIRGALIRHTTFHLDFQVLIDPVQASAVA
jgi:hypothetical protein